MAVRGGSLGFVSQGDTIALFTGASAACYCFTSHAKAFEVVQ
jgi:hypothetical protein